MGNEWEETKINLFYCRINKNYIIERVLREFYKDIMQPHKKRLTIHTYAQNHINRQQHIKTVKVTKKSYITLYDRNKVKEI